MDIRNFSAADNSDIAAATAFWNQNVETAELPYRKLSDAEFTDKMVAPWPGMEKLNLLAYQGDTVIGFAHGVYLPEKRTGYVTMVMVAPEHRHHGVGTALYQQLEQGLRDADSAHHGGAEPKPDAPANLDIIFFNPINLEWIVPGTAGHDHPNSPGVDLAGAGYGFFKRQGFRDLALQNSYYRKLASYELTPEIKNKIAELKSKGIEITYYDPEKHYGFTELFDDLGNELWRETIIGNVESPGGGDPVLIVSDNGKIVGFTGPLRVQPSKRGYFAGIGVHSDYRKLGAGKVLFASLCQGLKDMGADYMTLFTGETNPARRMYEANGFEIVKSWMDMRKPLHN